MPSEFSVEVENVGGIETDAEHITEGITVLSGQNATNRTSMMQALMAGLGSDDPHIRAGATEGSVKLSVGDEEYVRTVTSPTEANATSGTAADDTPTPTSHWDGEGAASDIELLELFAFLTEENPIRWAVAAGEDLYSHIMQPVDTADIEQEIEILQSRREELSGRKESLPEKEDRVEQLAETIETKQDKIEEKQAELEAIEAEIAEIDEQEVESETLDKSKEINNRIKELSNRVSDLKQEITSLEHDREAKKEELADLRSTEFEDTDDLREEIQRVKGRISTLEDEQADLEADKRVLNPLQQFLSQITHDSSTPTDINEVFSKYGSGEATGAIDAADEITDLLVSDPSETQCVLCGGDLEEGTYEQLLTDVTTIINQINDEVDEIAAEMSTLRDERDTLKGQIADIRDNKDRIDELESEIENVDEKLEAKQTALEDTQEELSAAKDELAALEDEAVDNAEDRSAELRSLESEKTELEVEINTLESDIESHKQERDSLKEEIGGIKTEVNEKLPEIKAELTDLRGKVEAIEDEIVTQFNDQMDDLVDQLGFENIERIWIEKKVKQVKEGRQTVEQTVFDLNVVREIDGKATQDVVENLSESEREITGLVLALTGYLVHDVADSFPIVIMDSVEMIDANRLETLLEYIEPHTDYLVVSALPEDTEAMTVGSVIQKGRRKTVSD